MEGSIRSDPELSTSYAEVRSPSERIAIAAKHEEEALNAIHSGALRIKNQALITSSEVNEQNVMLDEIALDVQTTTRSVEQEANRALAVTKRHNKLCVYYVIISALSIILVTLLAI